MEIGLIRDLSVVERPRERLLALGPAALQDAELLALVLRTGVPGSGALELARTVLERFPLRVLVGLPVAQLKTVHGIGLSKAATFVAALELARRAQDDTRTPGSSIDTVQDIARQALDIREKKKEYLLAFFLNARRQLICRETISIGTLTASLAHPREIFAPAIGKAAASVILVHNHPSGDPTPSDEDRRLTQRIAQAGRLLGIELLDHLILAEGGSYSFKTSGGL